MACVGRWIVGVFAALLLGVAPPLVAASSGHSAALRVDAFDVEQVASFAPGTQLFFSVFATLRSGRGEFGQPAGKCEFV